MMLRALAKKIAYSTGALGMQHAWLNRDALTVAMFHRVLRPNSPEWSVADPTYRISDAVFADCLAFFKRHYHPVGVEQVASALAGDARLPDHALLVTFDDGWADNIEVGLPLLRKAGMPAVVFVVPEAIEEPAATPWWHETIFRARRNGRLSDRELVALWSRCGWDMPLDSSGIELVFAFIRRLQPLPGVERDAILAQIELPGGMRIRQMMTREQVRDLASAGIAIGVHGYTHVPLTFVERPQAELENAMRYVESLFGTEYVPARTLSFPHGRYNDAIVEMARESGFRVQCSSDPNLNRMRAGRPVSDLLGRISIVADAITDKRGRFHPELLATWLFRRPIAAIRAPEI
jgi:peptidoglycan/xylan/chitin deacetylase (PgdA/CDA1 family)